MPPKKRKYPEYCYDIVEYEINPGASARTLRKRVEYFENPEKVAEYRRTHDLDRLEAIQAKKKEEQKKKREEERKKKKPPPPKKKPKPKKKKKKEEEPAANEEIFEFLEEEEAQEEFDLFKRWEEEEQRREERLNQKDREEEEESRIIIEEHVPSLEDYFHALDEERQQIRAGNNINTGNRYQDLFQETQNRIEARRYEDADLDDEDDLSLPAVDPAGSKRTFQQKATRKRIKDERRSNYFLTVVSPATLKDYTEDEIELIAAEMQRRVNEQLYLYAPDYIKFLEANDSLDLITRIEFITKPELQEARGENGQLHTHSIIAITHSSRIHLDYNMLYSIMQDVAKEMGFYKKKTGGLASFQVQIQRASDSTQNEYDYLAEDGVMYEAGDISSYYEQAEAAIRDGTMERSDLQRFKRRKKEVASAQKTVRELRGQRFNF